MRRTSSGPLVAIVVCVTILLILLGLFLWDWRQEQLAKQSYEELRDSYTSSVTPTEGEEVKTIDFQGLREENPDTIGWLTIPGTTIDFPVVQGRDNTEYLTTAFDGTYSASGAVFLDAGISITDARVFVVYGHNMGWGRSQIFSPLKAYSEEEFGQSHRVLEFTTAEDEAVVTWQVFAVVEADVSVVAQTRQYFRMSIQGSEALGEYMDFLQDHSLYALPIGDEELVPERILVLSTCISGRSDRRLLICAVQDGEDNKTWR